MAALRLADHPSNFDDASPSGNDSASKDSDSDSVCSDSVDSDSHNASTSGSTHYAMMEGLSKYVCLLRMLLKLHCSLLTLLRAAFRPSCPPGRDMDRNLQTSGNPRATNSTR